MGKNNLRCAWSALFRENPKGLFGHHNESKERRYMQCKRRAKTYVQVNTRSVKCSSKESGVNVHSVKRLRGVKNCPQQRMLFSPL